VNYNEWLRALAKLPKSAEFCLADVTERISSGNHVINFLITEAKGSDLDMTSRRGQKKEICRARTYVGYYQDFAHAGYTMDVVDINDPNGGRVEITEPTVEVEKSLVRTYSFSLHEFFLLNSRLCESVLTSLTTKIAVISEHSKAVLESQLGDEIVKMVTKRLAGGDEEGASLKEMLMSQVSDKMNKHIAAPVRRAVQADAQVTDLAIQDGDLFWRYQHADRIDITLNWKGVQLHWDGKAGYVTNNAEVLCVRDTFLCLVNLPSFGEMIVGKLAKIIG
jgi:hypothetical protein